MTTSVVTVGLLATGDTSLTPPIGTVLRMVPGIPGTPFSTTWTHEQESLEHMSLNTHTHTPVYVCVTCVRPCWPAALILGTVVMILLPLPGVTILVVRRVIGLLAPVGGGVSLSQS